MCRGRGIQESGYNDCMSVRVSDRTESRAEYVNKVRELNEVIGLTVANGPRKYMPTYGDRLINTALDAYMEVLEANSIYPSKGIHAEPDYLRRRGHLIEARSKVIAVAGIADVYFSMLMRVDNAGSKSYDKAFSRLERIGLLCADVKNLISGVLASDAKKFKEYNASKVASR